MFSHCALSGSRQNTYENRRSCQQRSYLAELFIVLSMVRSRVFPDALLHSGKHCHSLAYWSADVCHGRSNKQGLRFIPFGACRGRQHSHIHTMCSLCHLHSIQGQ